MLHITWKQMECESDLYVTLVITTFMAHITLHYHVQYLIFALQKNEYVCRICNYTDGDFVYICETSYSTMT